MPIKCRKTILIGLGGTGARALVHIKREFLKQPFFGGEIPPTLKLIGIDTNISKESLKLEGRDITLSDPEFMHLTVTNVRELVDRTPEIAAWILPANKRDLRDIINGTGARRTSGRLALFAYAPVVYERLKAARTRVAEITNENFVTRNPNLVLSEDPVTYIFIICSLAGGTGGGMFLDIGYFCREIWKDVSHRIFGVFLLPGIFEGKPATKFVVGNGYAALKELDYWLDQNASVPVKYPGLDRPIMWGGETNKPFDYICLLDNANEAGQTISNIDTMLHFVARSVFLYMTVDIISREGQIQDFWTNLNTILQEATPWEGRHPKYMSFGMSSLEIPVEDILNQTTGECVLNLIENDLVPPNSQFKDSVQTLVRDFMSERGLKGEALMEVVIPNAYTPDISPIEDKVHTKTANAVTQWRERAVADVKNDFQKHASIDSPQYQLVLHNTSQAIEQELSRVLHDKGGIGNTKLFLQTLINNLRSERSELEEKAQEVRQKLLQWDRGYQDLEEREVKPAFDRTFRKGAVGEAIRKVRAYITQHSNLLRDEARNQVGINLLASLITKVSEYLDRVQELERRLNQVVPRVREQLRQAGERSEDPFTRYLRRGFLDPLIEARKQTIDVGLLVDTWVKQVHELEGAEAPVEALSLLKLADLPIEKMFLWLWDTVRSQFKDIQENLTIEEILRRILDDQPDGRQRANEAIHQFVKRALPMWGIVAIPPEKQREIEELLIFGVLDPDNSVFKNHVQQSGEINITSAQGTPDSAAFTTTWERHSIRVLRLKVPVPLHVIERLRDYKTRYLRVEDDPDARITHHIHRDWMGSKALPDIFPYERL